MFAFTNLLQRYKKFFKYANIFALFAKNVTFSSFLITLSHREAFLSTESNSYKHHFVVFNIVVEWREIPFFPLLVRIKQWIDILTNLPPHLYKGVRIFGKIVQRLDVMINEHHQIPVRTGMIVVARTRSIQP